MFRYGHEEYLKHDDERSFWWFLEPIKILMHLLAVCCRT